MKAVVVALAGAIIACAAPPAMAGGTFKPSHGTFGNVPDRKPGPAASRQPSSGLWAPVAPHRAAPDLGPKTFKPYGDYSHGSPPSAPKPPGYVDYYGTKRSQHPFLY